jgi:hypothetical protein
MESDAEILKRVFDRLLSTPESKLQAVLSKLLPKLVRLADVEATRQLLIEIFGHLLKRIRPNSAILLPCR